MPAAAQPFPARQSRQFLLLLLAAERLHTSRPQPRILHPARIRVLDMVPQLRARVLEVRAVEAALVVGCLEEGGVLCCEAVEGDELYVERELARGLPARREKGRDVREEPCLRE